MDRDVQIDQSSSALQATSRFEREIGLYTLYVSDAEAGRSGSAVQFAASFLSVPGLHMTQRWAWVAIPV